MNDEKNIDKSIREALARNVGEELNPYVDQQSLLEQAFQLFQGRNRWINSIMVPISIGFLVLSVYSAYRFYEATDVKQLIGWSMAFMFGMLTISMMKIWAWMEIEKYSTIREIKRVELQLALLHKERE